MASVRLPTDRETGDLKGIGYIEFATAEGKEAASSMDGAEVAGGWLKVDLNAGTPGSGGGGRGGGGGGYGGGGGGRFSGRGGRFSGGRGGRGGGRGGRDGGSGGRGGGSFKPRMSIDMSSGGSGKKVKFDD